MNINDNSDISWHIKTVHDHLSPHQLPGFMPESIKHAACPLDCIWLHQGSVWRCLVCAYLCKQVWTTFACFQWTWPRQKDGQIYASSRTTITCNHCPSAAVNHAILHASSRKHITWLYYTLLILTQSQPMCCANLRHDVPWIAMMIHDVTHTHTGRWFVSGSMSVVHSTIGIWVKTT